MEDGLYSRPIAVKETSRKFMDMLGWGFILWTIGFVMGMALFVIVPESMIGYYILPVMLPLTFIVSYTRLKNRSAPTSYYLLIGLSWVAVAVILDYILLVRAFNVQNYYDADVLLYYVLAFAIPVLQGIGLAE
jgi:hypothetical protein